MPSSNCWKQERFSGLPSFSRGRPQSSCDELATRDAHEKQRGYRLRCQCLQFMLVAPLLQRRVSWRLHAFASRGVRLYSRGEKGQLRRPRGPKAKKSDGTDARSAPASDRAKQPSLIAQLFPEETKRHEEAQQREAREIPRLPLEPFQPPPQPVTRKSQDDDAYYKLRRERQAQPPGAAVLVLRNASKNLAEEDFRRLIPQGKHMEGWTLEQGDILKVVPGRNIETLEQQNVYFLIFASALSAFTYQGHASKIHSLVAAHAPRSVRSPIPPPPGQLIDGMDAHAAIQSFTLVPSTQSLELRQLRPPLSPLVHSIAQNGGYPSLTKRKDRMPYEARLTLEGPQIHSSGIRHALLAAANERGCSWSGGAEIVPQITSWEQGTRYEGDSPGSGKADAYKHAEKGARREQRESVQAAKGEEAENESTQDATQQQGASASAKRRTSPLVYILGFHTERAMQSFVRFWHRRPLSVDEKEREDLPPIANVEVLW